MQLSPVDSFLVMLSPSAHKTLLFACFWLYITTSPALSSPPAVQPTLSYDVMRGFALWAFNSSILELPSTLEELKDLKRIGVNWVNVNFELFQENVTSNSVACLTCSPKTPSLNSFKTYISKAHRLGLSISLAPVILTPNDAMINVNPSNVSEWFDSYGSVMTDVALLCEALQVEALSVGVELLHLSGQKDLRSHWLVLIQTLRQVFSGKLTYHSIFLNVELVQVSFWDALDFIGADAYVPLQNATNVVPSQSRMLKWYLYTLQLFKDWQAAQPANVSSLPLIFTEVGYPSNNNGFLYPYNYTHPCTKDGSAKANFTVQKVAWQVVFDAILNTSATAHRSSESNRNQHGNYFHIPKFLVEGLFVFWMDNAASSDYYRDRYKVNNSWACSWTPRGKPAWDVIAQGFTSYHY